MDERRRIQISPLTVKRLSLYLRFLEDCSARRQATVSSSQLATNLGLTAAQVRKDLAYFGQFGRPGVGYDVAGLTARLRHIFGTDKPTNAAVVGIGGLGGALLRYKGFLRRGFRLVAAFDSDPAKAGRRFNDVVIRPISEMQAAVRDMDIRLAVLAVPAEAAQEVANSICRAGIKGILNFTSVTLSVPEPVAVVPVDLAVQMEQLSYLVNASPGEPRPRRTR